MKKVLPKFKREDEEREFWAAQDSTAFINWKKGRRVILPNLKPSSQTISLRLPKPLLDQLKLLANKRDVPYQSLLKLFVAERLKAELESLGVGNAAEASRLSRVRARGGEARRAASL